jgi:hypothetical protein
LHHNPQSKEIIMAKKATVNKTKEVAAFLKAHPQAKAVEVSTALGKKGIKIKPAHVANIKSNLKRRRHARKAMATISAAPSVTTEPAKTGDALTLQHVKTVAQTIKDMGGFNRLKELLEVIREVGGLKKFRDLLEAMAVTEKDVVQS